MVCENRLDPGQTPEGRKAAINEALKKLEKSIGNGDVRLIIGPTGAVVFASWDDRRGLTDACAYRTLAARGSLALRMALARAEAIAGRKVDARQVAAGTHSHDGGRTWHPGH